jgi:DNA-binding SARP family transcriptional activator
MNFQIYIPGEYLKASPMMCDRTRTQLDSDFRESSIVFRGILYHGLKDKALDALKRVLMYDPYDEEAIMRIVNIKLRDGDRATAIKAYKQYEKLLIKELGITPSKKFPLENLESSCR